VVAGCGGSGAGPAGGTMKLAEQPVSSAALEASAPYVSPGEVISYRLSVLGVEIGAFTIAVGSFVDVQGRSTIEVQAGVQSTGIAAVFKKVRTEFVSWIDARTGKPVVGRVVETAGKDDPTIETTEARFHAIRDRLLPIAMVPTDGSSEKLEEQTLAGDAAWDVPSMLMYLRGWGAEVGTEVTAQVLRSRYIWQGQFRVAGREAKSTELGSLPTVRIDGLSRRILRDGSWEPDGDIRKFSVWITDDADRVPVLVVAKTDFGDVKMEIVGYTPGVGILRPHGAEASGASATTPQ
jgi:hypothetical protein